MGQRELVRDERTMLRSMASYVESGWAILYRERKWFLLRDTTAKYPRFAIFHWHTKDRNFVVWGDYSEGWGGLRLSPGTGYGNSCGHKPPIKLRTSLLMVT